MLVGVYAPRVRKTYEQLMGDSASHTSDGQCAGEERKPAGLLCGGEWPELRASRTATAHIFIIQIFCLRQEVVYVPNRLPG